MSILTAAQDKFIPKKTITGDNKRKACGLKTSDVQIIKTKHRAWQRFMETRSCKKYKEYTRLRNKVKSITRRAQRDVEKDIAQQVKENPKKFWNYVKSRTKVKGRIPDLYKNGKNQIPGMAETDKEKAEVLSAFFSSVFTIEPDNDVPTPAPKDIIHELNVTDITKEDIIKKL